MNRAEHLAWCKKRALEYVLAGDVNQAFTSMVSDLRKHSGTENHPGAELGFILMMNGHLREPDKMRKFIDEFN